MQTIAEILSTNTIVFSLLHYDVSAIELIGTIAGSLSVWWATKNNVLTWHIGFVNVIAFLLIFFQVQLYADVLLQVFYLFATAYGLWAWNRKTGYETSLQITSITKREWFCISISTVLLFLTFFAFTQLLPILFTHQPIKPASFAIIDATLSAASVVTTILIARKKTEAWLIWIIIDFSSVFLYLQKGVLFISIEYAIFGLLAIQGYVLWRRAQKNT